MPPRLERQSDERFRAADTQPGWTATRLQLPLAQSLPAPRAGTQRDDGDSRRDWPNSMAVFGIVLDNPLIGFKPGQYVSLGVLRDGSLLQRAILHRRQRRRRLPSRALHPRVPGRRAQPAAVDARSPARECVSGRPRGCSCSTRPISGRACLSAREPGWRHCWRCSATSSARGRSGAQRAHPRRLVRDGAGLCRAHPDLAEWRVGPLVHARRVATR